MCSIENDKITLLITFLKVIELSKVMEEVLSTKWVIRMDICEDMIESYVYICASAKKAHFNRPPIYVWIRCTCGYLVMINDEESLQTTYQNL